MNPVTMFGVMPKVNDQPPLTPGLATALDWDASLSLDMIRSHTKTDDVPSVTDDQLKLYRRAAVEAAELYTGLVLSCQRNIIEPIAGPRPKHVGKTSYRHTLSHPVADGVVWIYGGDFRQQIMVPPNTRNILVPTFTGSVDLSNCCDPCSPGYQMNGGLQAMYKAGFSGCAGVPAAVLLGILQFVAWVIEHPGDEFLTTRNRTDSRSGGAYGSNNIALVSGALETWRTVDPEAI